MREGEAVPGRATEGLRFEKEAARPAWPPRLPAPLRRALRLRVYVPGLAALAAGVFLSGGRPLAWALLGAWFAAHWLVQRAGARARHTREVATLGRILAAGGGVAAFYRREKTAGERMANPPPDPETDFGGHLIARADPAHHLRKRHARRWLRGLSRPGGRAGDVGCLAGDVSLEHARAGHRVFLFDLDTASLRRAAEKTGWPAVQADAARLPISGEALGLITALEVIEHLADPGRAMREMAAALAPGGRLLASTDNTGCLLAFHLLNPLIVLERLAGLFFPALLPPRFLVKEDARTGKAYPHASFDAAQIRLLAAQAGLRVMWLKSYYFFPGFHRLVAKVRPGCTEEEYVRLVLPVERFLQAVPLLSRLGTHWVFACEKPASSPLPQPSPGGRGSGASAPLA